MPATAVYADKDDVKIKLGIDATDTDFDALITSQIEQISRVVDSVVFGPTAIGFVTDGNDVEEWTEFHDGGIDAIILNRLLTDSVTKRGELVLLENDITLTQGTDYQVDQFPDRTIRRTSAADQFDRLFAAGHRNVQITYTPAYLNTPKDVVMVVEDESARLFLKATTRVSDGGFLVSSQRTPLGGDTLTYREDDLSPMSLRVLTAHKSRLSFF